MKGEIKGFWKWGRKSKGEKEGEENQRRFDADTRIKR